VSRVGLALLVGAALFAHTSLAFADAGGSPESPTIGMDALSSELDPQTAATAAVAESVPSESAISEAGTSVALESGLSQTDAAQSGSASGISGDVAAAIHAAAIQVVSTSPNEDAVDRVAVPEDTRSTAVIPPDHTLVSPSRAGSTTPVHQASAGRTSAPALSNRGPQYQGNTRQYQARNFDSISWRAASDSPNESESRTADPITDLLPIKPTAIGLWNCLSNSPEDDLCPIAAQAPNEDVGETGEPSAEQLADAIISRLPAEDAVDQLAAALGSQTGSATAPFGNSATSQGVVPPTAVAGGYPPPLSPVSGGTRPSSSSLPDTAALPNISERVPQVPTRPVHTPTTGSATRGNETHGAGAGLRSRAEGQWASGLTDTRAGSGLPAAHPHRRASHPVIRPDIPAGKETAGAERVQRTSPSARESRDQAQNLLWLAVLMFAVGLACLVLAMVLESRGGALATLGARLRSRGLSTPRDADHPRRGATSGRRRDGIRYRE
jgi:hypothetical protein